MSDLGDKQIKAMGEIMRAFNSIDDDAEQSSVPLIEGSASAPVVPDPHAGLEAPTSEIPAYAGTHEGNIAAMRSIMGAFREATDNIREDAQEDPALMEALVTERTERGVRIAEWEIVVTEHASEGKYYDVVCGDDIAIATDLRLYEAALLLTQELNRGSSITSDAVRQILALESQYARNLNDAIRYSRMVKKTQGPKRDVALSRLTEAKAKAIAAKEQINEMR